MAQLRLQIPGASKWRSSHLRKEGFISRQVDQLPPSVSLSREVGSNKSILSAPKQTSSNFPTESDMSAPSFGVGSSFRFWSHSFGGSLPPTHPPSLLTGTRSHGPSKASWIRIAQRTKSHVRQRGTVDQPGHKEAAAMPAAWIVDVSSQYGLTGIQDEQTSR